MRKQARTIRVELSGEACEKYDAAITGDDEDVLLAVEKAIVGTLYPDRVIRADTSGVEVDLDFELVSVEEGEPIEEVPA